MSQKSTEAATPYTVIIGLEVHVQLKTKTKLFCGCSTEFGQPSNTQTCPVCLGLPGSLPVMNQEAFRLGAMTALALNCEVPSFTKWDRKNYFYPDLPKGYQISQYDLPMSQNGWLEISDSKERFPAKKIGIIRAHLEEDAGKSMHDEHSGKADSKIDLNRTGTPLLEIVSQPDIRSPLEAKAYLSELKLLLSYIDVSDCNMQEGSLRVDANVNLHIPKADGSTAATPIVEIKNVNSFRAVERALEYEIQRQWAEWQATGKTKGSSPKQTFGWDDQREVTYLQREKEESSDYRYFPDPDLLPVRVSDAERQAFVASLAELPAVLRQRLESDWKLTPYDSDVLVNQGRPVVDYFLEAAKICGDGKKVSNWIQQDVLRCMNEESWTIEQFPISAVRLGELVSKIQQGDLENSRAKDVFAKMMTDRVDVVEAMKALGIVRVGGNVVREICEQLLAANPQIVDDYKGGKKQALGSLIGMAKKANPNVNPNDVRSMLTELLGG